jgi:AcrR family transcriptional regulator
MVVSKKRDAVIETATTLFSEQSYLSVGVDKIIAESNVAKMTFYKYFPSKENLIEAVLENRRLYIQYSLEELVNEKNLPMDKLQAIFNWFESWFFSEDFHGCMFIKASEEFPSNLKFRKIGETYKKWLHTLLSDILDSMGKKPSTDISALIVIIIDGLIVKANTSLLSPEEVKLTWNHVIRMIDVLND